MKILKPGKIPPPPVPWWIGASFRCHNCGVEFLLEQDDAGKISVSTNRGSGQTWIELHCPTDGCFEDNGSNIRRTLRKDFHSSNLNSEVK